MQITNYKLGHAKSQEPSIDKDYVGALGLALWEMDHISFNLKNT